MRWNRKGALPELCADLVTAARGGDEKAFTSTHRAVVSQARRADAAELTAAVHVLAPALADVPLANGGPLATLVGGLVEMGADPTAALDPLVLRVADGLERAAGFPGLWEKSSGGGEPPAPEDTGQIPVVLDGLRAVAEQAGVTRSQAGGIAEAWFTVGDWVPGLLVSLQRKDVRQALPHRQRLTAAAAAVREDIDTAYWMYGLLQVLDDEPVIVLHRATGRGYRVTLSGIGDNFQLHTLLAATLIGDPARGLIPGEPPQRRWVAAATDGETQPRGGIMGQFNLVDAFGEWIWNEGRPAGIPLLDGRRVIVVDPPPYPRSWNAGRVYPLMRPTITLDGFLGPDEAARWMSKVAPDGRAS
ncbi:MAG TPA: hypothetical protein VGP31_02580 [Planosporangium sp.]|jgi:hypothetical protein|nr:hypothetical protein [Planosporangium sp.]